MRFNCIEEIALIETKDVKWLHKRILMENRKIERLRKSVQIFEVSVGEDSVALCKSISSLTCN